MIDFMGAGLWRYRLILNGGGIMKAKDLATWWWNYDAPWWVWLLLFLFLGIFPIHLTIKF